MATFLSTVKFTEQGLKDIDQSCQRAAAFEAVATEMGANVRDIFWTLGSFDGLVAFDAPDEETAAAIMLKISAAGNVHTQTTRAFSASEMQNILAKL